MDNELQKNNESRENPAKISPAERLSRYLAGSARHRVLFGCILAAIALLFTIAAGAAVYFRFSRHTVTFVTAEGSETRTVSAQEAVSFPDVTAPEKLSFIGWKDSQGNMERRSSVNITADTVYTAQYITALDTEDHVPYLFPDDNGLYRPQDAFTRGEAAMAINAILCGKVEADKNFADVTDDMECSQATAQLKALGVADGSRFYPDDAITLVDLLHLLTSFYRSTDQTFDFSFISPEDYGYEDFCTAASLGWIDADSELDPNGTMTRQEAAVFLNHILGRSGDTELLLKETGVLSDCGPFDEAYLQFAEATVEHSYELTTDGTENWTDSNPPEKLYSGYVLVGGKLRCADADGFFVKGTNEDGLTFKEDGSYTSGNDVLDDYVWAFIAQVTDDSMTREERLHAVYDALVAGYEKNKKGSYPQGSEDWMIDEAIYLFENGGGNSYSFAGAFWAAARGLGYPVKAESGLMLGNAQGWVTMKEGDTWYIYDPESEIDLKMSCWKMDRYAYYPWGYNPDPQVTYGPNPEEVSSEY